MKLELGEPGLVRTVAGRGTFVRALEVTVVPMERGTRIFTRPATDAERAEMGLGAGIWILVAERADGTTEVLPGDAAEIRLE